MTEKKPEAPAATKPTTPEEAAAILQAHHESERDAVRKEVDALLKARGYTIVASPYIRDGVIVASADVVKV